MPALPGIYHYLFLRIDGVNQSLQIAYGEELRETTTTGMFGIAHPGIVIRTTHPIIVNVAVGSHALGHVSFPIVVERFRKVIWRASHIAEMDEEYLLLFPEMTNGSGQIVGHQGEIALTEGYSIYRTWDKVNEFLVILYTAHDPSDPANRR